MPDSPPLSVPDPLPLGLTDPDAFVRQANFHQTTTFRPAHALREDHIVSYAVVGSTDAAAPWVVWLNGMGSHRLAATFLDGLARERGVRLVSFDRPGAGKSTRVPLKHRVEASYDALAAVLKAEGITQLGLFTHSNGLVYALYALPRLARAGVHVNAWAMSAPWVPPWLSGSPLLTVARHLPAALTGSIGSVFGAVEAALGPLGSAFGWSSGLAREAASFSGGLLQGGAGSGAEAAAQPPGRRGPLSPQQQYLLDAKRDRSKPPHKQTYNRRFHSAKAVDAGMAIVIKEGVSAIGEEALVCLAKGDGANWGWGADADGTLNPERQYERGFNAVKTAWLEAPRMAPRRIRVWYGEGDMIVPRKGREYLRRLVVDSLGLVEANDWVEVRNGGHDDVIGLTVFAEPLMDMFVAAAGVGAARRADD